MDKQPDQLKLPFVLWNRAAVQRLIAKRYHVTLSLRAVGNYLARWGMTPQKPLKRAYEKCGEAVDQWLKVTYPKIKKQAQKQRATIYWGDQMGLRSDHTAGRSYSPKGKTPVMTDSEKGISTYLAFLRAHLVRCSGRVGVRFGIACLDRLRFGVVVEPLRAQQLDTALK